MRQETFFSRLSEWFSNAFSGGVDGHTGAKVHSLFGWLAAEGWAHFVQSLLHTLWIGAFVAVVLYFLLRRITDPVARYRWSIAALTSVLLGGLICWSVLQEKSLGKAKPAVATTQNQTLGEMYAAFNNGEFEKGSPATIIEQTWPTVSRIGLRHWIPWLALVWMSGTVFMLGRTLWLVGNAERVRRASKPLENKALLELIERAQTQLQLAKKIQIAITEELTSPAVLGIFVPMLVLPLSLVTTLPMNQLQLIILHELAHIQRGDYFVNLCQLLAESVLFFNPAVWWISRQIRQEREACCDAMAIALAGGRVEYARTLVQIAEEVLGSGTDAPVRHSPAGASACRPTASEGACKTVTGEGACPTTQDASVAAIAFGGDHKRSSLRDRISRLLVPAYKPTVHLTRRAMMLWLVLGGAFLFLSAMGTRWTVSAAAHLLTPQQRIEHIEKKMTAYGEPPRKEADFDDEKTRVKVTAKVRMKDGSPLPRRNLWVDFVSLRHRSTSGTGGNVDKDGISKAAVPPGDLYVVVWSDELPPSYCGPIDIRGKKEVNDLEVVMEPGFPVSLEVVDAESREPLANASASFYYSLPDGYSGFGPKALTADAKGIVTLARCTQLPLAVTCEKPGYETLQKNFEAPKPNQQLKMSLRRALTTSGVITDKATGNPLPGATIHVLASDGPNPVSGHNFDQPGTPLATTDAQGRFEITQLRRDLTYSLLVKAPQREHLILYDVKAGQKNLRAVQGPELIVRGKIIGDVNKIRKQDGKRLIFFNWGYDAVHRSRHENTGYVEPRIENGVASFVFTNPIAGSITVHVGEQEFQRDVREPVENWELNATALAAQSATNKMRKVILKFEHPSGVPPKGTIHVSLPGDQPHTAVQKELEIINGQVEFEMVAGREFYGFEPAKTVGYWFEENNRTEVPDEPGPLVIHVPVIPAGAIYAHVLNPDGTRDRDASFSIRELKKSPLITDSRFWSHVCEN